MKRKIVFLFLLSVLFVNHTYAQCSMCKKVAGDAASLDNDTSVGEQLNTGILYLLAVPYIILAIAIIFAFRKKVGGFFRELKAAGRN